MHKALPRFDDDSYAHFVTTRTYQSRPHFKNEEFARILLEEIRYYSGRQGFHVLGFVIMPDHVHLLLWWDKERNPDLSISRVMQSLKGAAARRIIDSARATGLERMLQPTQEEETPGSSDRRVPLKPHRRQMRYRFWQPGFYDFNIYSEQKLLEKLDYMHANPVRAGLATSPHEHEWSSCRGYSDG